MLNSHNPQFADEPDHLVPYPVQFNDLEEGVDNNELANVYMAAERVVRHFEWHLRVTLDIRRGDGTFGEPCILGSDLQSPLAATLLGTASCIVDPSPRSEGSVPRHHNLATGHLEPPSPSHRAIQSEPLQTPRYGARDRNVRTPRLQGPHLEAVSYVPGDPHGSCPATPSYVIDVATFVPRSPKLASSALHPKGSGPHTQGPRASKRSGAIL